MNKSDKYDKKGEGLPINFIIVAALGLLVLFIVATIFTKESGRTISTLESCSGKGGICRDSVQGCFEGEAGLNNVKCGKTTEICCIKFMENKK